MKVFRRVVIASVVLLMAAWSAAGCNRHPKMEFKNVRLIALLRTACNTKNAVRLDKAVKEIDTARDSGDLAKDHHSALMKIVERARQGEWKEAEQACHEFQQAQVRY